MTKDESLKLALEALEKSVATCFDRYSHEQVMSRPEHFINQAITAIKQARALDKMAENARKLGLDYEPADGTQVSKVWWDGEKLMAKPIPLEDFYQPAPVQKGAIGAAYQKSPWDGKGASMSPPAAQRPWVGLTDDEFEDIELGCRSTSSGKIMAMQKVEAKLKEKNT